ncbi:hypothetical protein [Streptomyces sp. NPDC005423]|uniref:hypothetical protein n=1 Tax=Streptomyces sp. NPDC005423 TaxID=3155343 RepID=UPI0033B5551A
MPLPPPSRALPGPRRRSLVVSAAGAALLVGCSAGTEGTGGTGSGAVERARARAARDSQGLAERYDAVLAVHPALAQRLRPLRAEVVRHAEAFGGTGPASPSVTPSGTPSASPSAVPADEKGALAALATAERELADRRAKALVELPGELARLLASVAAAGAAHAYLLTGSAK